MIESALLQQLTANIDVTALVETRIYPVVWPDTPVFPLVTYQRISTVTQSVFSGPLSMATVRLQIDAWGAGYSDAKAVAEAINKALEGFQGTLPDGTRVDDIILDSQFDLFDSPSLRFRVSSDFLISYFRS